MSHAAQRPSRAATLPECGVAESRCPGRATNASAFVSSSVFALHFTEPPVSAQLLAFLRVFCMTEGKSFQEEKKKKMLTF